MHKPSLPKPKKISVALLSNAAALAGVRKGAVRAGQSHRAATDYRRREKHKKGFDY